MGTLKKFWIYFLIFIIGFALVSFLTYATMKENYKEIKNYEIKTETPVITVNEFKTTYSHGYIKGTITNNTGEHIPLEYLKIDLYDSDEIYVGTEYKELKYFNVNETINFEINFNYSNVSKAVIYVSDGIKEEEKAEKHKYGLDVNIDPVITEKTMKIALPIAGLLTFYTLLP